MLGNRSFYRTFVILKPMDKDFGIKSGREPTGYCKFEVRNNRGKLEVYVQDLKAADQGRGFYYIVMASNIKGIKPLKLTTIDVDGEGRGKVSLNFDPDSIQDSGHSLDKYHGIAVVLINKRTEEHKYPLVGYSNKRIELDWHGAVTSYLGDTYKQAESLEAEEQEGFEDFEANIYRVAPVEVDSDDDESIKDSDYIKVRLEDESDDISGDKIDHYEYEEDNGSILGDQCLDDEIGPQADYEDRYICDELDNTGFDDMEEIKADPLESGDSTAEENHMNFDMDFKDTFDTGYVDTSKYEEMYKDEYNNSTGHERNYTYDRQSDKDQPYINLEDEEISEYKVDSKASKRNTQFGDDLFRDQLDARHSGEGIYWDKVKDYYLGLFKKHKKVCPFEDPVGEVDWIRIEHISDDLYPYYPGPAYGYKSTGVYLDHYLVGLAREKGKLRYVVYGIPGLYSAVPPMSMHGFSRWLPLKNGYGDGYWLLYIDINTGQIAYPY